MIWATLIGLVLGIVLAALLRHLLFSPTFQQPLQAIQSQLQLFRQAVGDDERQRQLMHLGFITLRLNLQLLLLFSLLLAVVILPPWMSEWPSSLLGLYFAAMALGAVITCLAHKTRRSPLTPPSTSQSNHAR